MISGDVPHLAPLPGDRYPAAGHPLICDRTLAYRLGNISEVFTEHYRQAHPEALGLTAE
jgi:hypothetical protein